MEDFFLILGLILTVIVLTAVSYCFYIFNKEKNEAFFAEYCLKDDTEKILFFIKKHPNFYKYECFEQVLLSLVEKYKIDTLKLFLSHQEVKFMIASNVTFLNLLFNYSLKSPHSESFIYLMEHLEYNQTDIAVEDLFVIMCRDNRDDALEYIIIKNENTNQFDYLTCIERLKKIQNFAISSLEKSERLVKLRNLKHSLDERISSNSTTLSIRKI